MKAQTSRYVYVYLANSFDCRASMNPSLPYIPSPPRYLRKLESSPKRSSFSSSSSSYSLHHLHACSLRPTTNERRSRSTPSTHGLRGKHLFCKIKQRPSLSAMSLRAPTDGLDILPTTPERKSKTIFNFVEPFRSSYPTRDATYALCSDGSPDSRSACRRAV